MNREQKIEWMAVWAAKNGLRLELEGECGFGRECVGVIRNSKYPDYYWYNGDYERTDLTGEVWTPPDSYHKHACVAVLGRGEKAEKQLYEWLQWFDANHSKLETGENELPNDGTTVIRVLMGQHHFARMVKQPSPVPQSNDGTTASTKPKNDYKPYIKNL